MLFCDEFFLRNVLMLVFSVVEMDSCICRCFYICFYTEISIFKCLFVERPKQELHLISLCTLPFSLLYFETVCRWLLRFYRFLDLCKQLLVFFCFKPGLARLCHRHNHCSLQENFILNKCLLQCAWNSATMRTRNQWRVWSV